MALGFRVCFRGFRENSYSNLCLGPLLVQGFGFRGFRGDLIVKPVFRASTYVTRR